MIVGNIKYYSSKYNDIKVKKTLMEIIDRKSDSTLMTRIKYAFISNGEIQGNEDSNGIYFFRSNSSGHRADIFYVAYYFRTFEVNNTQILKVKSVLNPLGLFFIAIIFSFAFFGLLNEMRILNSELNLLGGVLISMCFYGVVFIAYKMNRDSTLMDIEKLLKLKPIKLKEL